MHLKLLLVSVLVARVTCDEVTFKNVVARFYSLYTHKFNVTIKSSTSLKENIPKKLFDTIKITDSHIPVLYKNSISDIENLDELVLNNDDISEIQPGAFKNVPELRKLEITQNKGLEEIKSGVFNNLNVMILILGNNSINSVATGAFDNMPQLLSVKLSDNKLQAWNADWFTNTPNLIRVSMQNNLIQEIPADAFKNLGNGKRSGGIAALPVNIILSYNRINQVDVNAFRGLTIVNNLWLDNNKIGSWNESLLSQTTVTDLRIDGNEIRCFSGGNFEKIFAAETTHIDDNPFDCQCLNDVKSWATKNNKNVVMYYAVMSCDVERIQQKMKDLQHRLNMLKNVEEIEPVTENYI